MDDLVAENGDRVLLYKMRAALHGREQSCQEQNSREGQENES